MPYHHFIAKFVQSKGPEPAEELQHIIDQAGDSEDGTAWFATRLGTVWQPAPPPSCSVCLVFHDGRENRCIRAVVAKVLQRNTQAPDTPIGNDLRDLYAGYGHFGSWWQVQDPVLVQFRSLELIPGVSENKLRTAHDTFRRPTFDYWAFDSNSPADLYSWVLEQLLQREVQPPSEAPPRVVETLTAASARRESVISASESLPNRKSDISIYGVDFSGGVESTQNGNRKIWIASWQPATDELSLRCGTDSPILCRRDLPQYVQRRPGCWVFDFPFGIAPETAVAILGTDNPTWEDWLQWCAEEGDATDLRNEARARTDAAGVKWSTRRKVDDEHTTTWFPLFQQLYRQTIYGAREVLHPLLRCCKDGVRPLPWHDPTDAAALVVEGFPGVTIRDQLALYRAPGKCISYKGRTTYHQSARQDILDTLMAPPFKLPICAEIRRRAVEDKEGDAVDALVLLVAGSVSQALGLAAWQASRDSLEEECRLVEGWFPS
jgi:hypothetical protein